MKQFSRIGAKRRSSAVSTVVALLLQHQLQAVAVLQEHGFTTIAQQLAATAVVYHCLQDSQPHKAWGEPVQLATNHHSTAVAAAGMGAVAVSKRIRSLRMDSLAW